MLTLFLGFLLAISASGQATAHARESFAPIETTQAADSGHWAGDGDEVPADADKGYPHHHASCHDHNVGFPATAGRLPLDERAAQTPASLRPTTLATADPAELLRPPRA
ncbi:hypothetical protein PBT88_15270 [Sphingomonas abietis]|uniref:Secreted protein n=2 Tax=Sphingomonas abietis TaxID=3012344 RepID=A0ABY7NUV2_9SPHN|nr:hypothetical protein [Sphingomonas abietis]WBO24665.1 hypothetical protein PBT88_15270 [Sphingomonas abietis]